MMRRPSPIVLLAIVALCAAGACAREPQTVHISKDLGIINGKRQSAQGSGVLCGGTPDGDKRVIMTVAHVVGSKSGSGEIIATIGGQRYLARLIDECLESDSAVLWVRNSGAVKEIEPALMYLGEIRTSHPTHSEGFANNQFIKRNGYAMTKAGSTDLVSSSWTTFGMSGGATYLTTRGDQPPQFIYLNSRSDLRSYGIGPETGYLYKWLPSIEHPDWQLTCNQGGLISMSPRRGPAGIIRRAVVTPAPRSAPATTAPT